ncbi:unnamed protein product [Caenorhabditis auriculariae]|uniref:SHSP domain-containing protein n=1 Tax=Caenorhabditis auriculariae TaxID=2777116 RepID=A0A8S1HER3_9PELO|nr:unnamed protein product [Caenorhabditis auriculariae]
MNSTIEHNTQWDWPLQPGDGVVTVFDDDYHFEVGLEAHCFTPKEIEVKAIGEVLEIHLEHKAREDQLGNVSRSITRCYKLPKNVDMKSIKSNLDNQGVLHIRGKKTH